MEKNLFHQHLIDATGHAFKFATEHVHNHLPDVLRYIVHLNQSFDENPLKPGEHVYPDDVEQHGEQTGPLLAEQVVALLWRDGTVPEWIDISVVRTDGKHTYMQLLCCGRFTDRKEHLYYLNSGVCPFGIKSPVLPPQWERGNERFDLHWRDSHAK